MSQIATEVGDAEDGQVAQVCRPGGSNNWLDAEVQRAEGASVFIKFQEQGSTKRKQMKVSDPNFRFSASDSRPGFLASASDVTDEMRRIQKECPTRWAMTLRQWNDFIEFCKRSQAWQEIKNKKKSVSLYDMNTRFVIPCTRGTGCSIAVLMNKDTLMNRGIQVDAKIMLSHSWAEDMEECQEAVNDHFQKEGIPEETTIWFCGFGLYQPDDTHGPTIQEQVDLHPFTKVISSEQMKEDHGRMIAVHTTGGDLWQRLWCVREVREAMSKKVAIRAAFSSIYEDHVRQKYNLMIDNGCSHQNGLDAAGFTVRCAHATCRAEDKATLLQVLLEHGTLEEIDMVTTNLRIELLRPLIVKAAGRAAQSGQPFALLSLVKQGDLVAVDWLQEVAAAGEKRAQDKLFEFLKSMAKGDGSAMKYGLLQLCRRGEAEKRISYHLINALLMTMAKRQHQQSFDLLLEHQVVQEYDMIGASEEDRDAIHRQRKYVALQMLALEGSEQALQKLGEFATKKQGAGDDKFAAQAAKSAQQALGSLAEQWFRPALKALRDLPDEKWAGEELKRVAAALVAGFPVVNRVPK